MRKLVLLNIYAFLLWIFALILSNFNLAIFRYLRSLSSLIIVLVLFGINLTAIIQIFRARLFSKIEILSVASVTALLATPLFLSVEYTFFGILSPKLPFINSLIIFILLIVLYYKKNGANFENFDFLNLNFKKENVLSFIKTPILSASLVYLASVIIIFSAFYALPELDPYYWYSSFQKMLVQGSITPLSGYRPLFTALIYALNQSSSVDLYAVFKYILPLMTLLLLVPAWLVAKNQNSRLKQFVILLVPFINASAFLYSQMPIPQAILNILVYYFVFFLLYAWINQSTLFYFLAGAIILLAYLYHESAVLIFSVWCVITVIFYLKKIIGIMKKNTLASFLILAIIIFIFSPLAKNPIDFLLGNLKKIPLPGSYVGMNFLFPAKYVNIDGNPMGWGNLTGVMKYYAYYAGPTFFIVILSVGYFLFRDSVFRRYVQKALLSKEVAVLFTAFLSFFSISEILPRFFNIAFLPERGWIFGGIFSIIFLLLLFKHPKKNEFIHIIITISLLINLSGAIYINNLKKNMITSDNIASAEWIKKNLPKNRIIFSNIKQSAMTIYSSSITLGVPNEFYYDQKIYQNNFEKFSCPANGLASDCKNKNVFYIYYSKINANNPYVNRPYYSLPDQSQDFIFDKHPDKFERVYFDSANNIIIWKIL